MKKILLSLFKQLAFWLLLFAFTRAVFLVYNAGELRTEKIGLWEALQAFYHALKLDLATACYLLVLPFFILFLQSLRRARFLAVLNKVYTALMIFVVVVITTVELGIYPEWKSKLTYKSLAYLAHPDEIFNSASTGIFLALTALLAAEFLLIFWAYRRWFFVKIRDIKTNYLLSALFLVLTPGFLFLGMRGGIQAIPINQSEAYFSQHEILNLAAVNSGYNIFQNILESKKYRKTNPYLFYEMKTAQQLVRSIHEVKKDTTVSILKVPKPNIVLVILESWSGDLIASLGAEPGITPVFHGLEKEGILFTNLYVSGNRSQQAMASIFGGFPSIPLTAITHDYEKFKKLPSLTKSLIRDGYQTSYLFGGQLIYGGLRAYILFNEFHKIIELKDFPESIPRGKLGVPDEYIFAKQLKELEHQKQPFFSAIFTVSTHSPYDEPMKEVLTWGGDENKFINSGYYTDKCIGEFMKQARLQPWYNNTLFIFVADHSHSSYRHYSVDSPEYRKIPLLFYGNVLKDQFKGVQISRISSQTDLPATLLKQLGLDASPFPWSKDLFNPYTPEFAYYEIDEGMGWIRPCGSAVYNKIWESYVNKGDEACKDSLVREGKSYLEVLFQQFMDY